MCKDSPPPFLKKLFTFWSIQRRVKDHFNPGKNVGKLGALYSEFFFFCKKDVQKKSFFFFLVGGVIVLVASW